MKLQKLIIKNFRGLKGENNIIDFSSSNIIFLIGLNNVGKSSFLRAYDFFINSAQKANTSDFYNYDVNIPIEIEGIFLKDENDDDDAELAVASKGKGTDPDWIKKWVDENNFIRIKKIWTETNTADKFTFSPESDEWVLNGFGGMPSLFQKHSPTPILISAMETENSLEEKVNKLIQDEILKKLKDDYGDDLNELITGVKKLQQKIADSEIVTKYNEEINEYFKKVFSDLTLKLSPKDDDNIKLEDSFKKNHSVTISKDGIDRNEVFTQYGHGVIRQALYNFLTFLKRSNEGKKKQYIILYEEPELFLHPEITFKLRTSLYDLAENSPFQVICATHSPLMIDISKPHSSLVRVIKKEDETTFTYQVGDEVFRSDADRKQRIQMINRFNPHVCESFYAKMVIIVEGDTEAIVFRDLIKRFYNDYEVYVLNSGSKNNIPFFQEIFTAFHINHCVIHDSDTRLNKDHSANSAWTLNSSIWDKIVSANQKMEGMARRYVHVENFEIAHGIISNGKDKPIKAFDFAQGLLLDSNAPCLILLKDLLGDRAILHDNIYVEQLN